jgi:hypothetical protein
MAVAVLCLHCGSDKDPGTGAGPGTGPGDAQTPPTGGKDLEAWLSKGLYKAWHCEADAHEARPRSGHTKNRICTNDLLSAHGAGEFPVGAAAVKELYAGNDVAGYAVYLHVKPGGGDSYYWYERTGGGLVADGLGTTGAPKDTCVSCHESAGPTRTGHDFVFTQVK